jgi:cytoskeletal protein RodZ
MRQGLDLADCAEATRIRERYLIAIEDGRFESLPGPAYVSGFIRAYASHLGVAVDGPERELPVPGGQGAPQGRTRPVTVTATRITARGVGQRPRWRRPLAVILLIAIVAIVLAAVAGVDLPLIG